MLPGNLAQALGILSEDDCLREGLGAELMGKYLALKNKDWKEFSTIVHEWERQRYLDV